EVLIGQMPGEQLTEQAATELSSESFEEEVASASEFDTLEEIEPGSSNVMDSTNELLALAAPSASAATSGDLQFDVAISGSGGSGGDGVRMFQSRRGNGMDIVIVFDSTGSMGGETDQVKRQIERIGSALTKLVPKARISLCTYRDEHDEYIVRGTPLTG